MQTLSENMIMQCCQNWVKSLWLSHKDGILLDPIIFFSVTDKSHVEFVLYNNATFKP